MRDQRSPRVPSRSRVDIGRDRIGLPRSRGLAGVGRRLVDAPHTGDGSGARFMLMRLDADVGVSLRVGRFGLRVPLRVGIRLSSSTRDSLAVRGRRSSVGS
jgi:hypothetical protein